MRASDLPRAETRLVTPRALASYAEGLGWQKVPGVNGGIAAYTNPREGKRQLVVPADADLDDYADRAAEAVVRLAEFEKRPAREVLEHLLLPPADVLSFRVVSPETETGDVPLEVGGEVIEGARNGLLAVAHSVLDPQPFFGRMRREEAKRFLSKCRMSTGRGSFVLSVACPLDLPLHIPGMEAEPYARRVTGLFVDALAALASAPQVINPFALANPNHTPGVSANLCEALLRLRPEGNRSHVTVSAAWSRALLPKNRPANVSVRFDQEAFELIETIAPQLRTRPEPKAGWYIGFVEELRGAAVGDDPRPAGEVRLTLFIEGEPLRARANLNAEDYALAGEAHLANEAVHMRGELLRLPRLNHLQNIEHFYPLEFDEEPDA